MIYRLLLLCCLSFGLTAPCLRGQAPQAPVAGKTTVAEPTLDLQDGDTLVFLGDSITHQCLHTQYVEDFFLTRYPERRIHFHNAGVSGDRAADALRRFDDDVAAFHPKYVTLMLGMNDGQYQDFSPEIFATYQRDMSELLDRIRTFGATAIIMTPTPFDHHQLALRMKDDTYRFRTREFSPQYNSVLGFYAGWLRESAGQRGLPAVDLWGQLNDFTFAKRRTDPDFSLVPDAIHPGEAGQFIMAYSLLSQFSPDRKFVSSISLGKRGNQWIPAGSNGTLTDLAELPEGAGLTFTHLSPALPWVVPASGTAEALKWESSHPAAMGMDLTKAGHRLGGERLKISGLSPGLYEITIDGKPFGKPVPHSVLAAKIELQANVATPQYAQAMEVALLNRERNDKSVRPLRDQWGRIKGLRNQLATATEEKKTKLEGDIAAALAKVNDLVALGREFEEKLHAASQPVPRHYGVRLLKPRPKSPPEPRQN